MAQIYVHDNAPCSPDPPPRTTIVAPLLEAKVGSRLQLPNKRRRRTRELCDHNPRKLTAIYEKEKLNKQEPVAPIIQMYLSNTHNEETHCHTVTRHCPPVAQIQIC